MTLRYTGALLAFVLLAGCGFTPPTEPRNACNVLDNAGFWSRRALNKYDGSSASDKARVLAVFFVESSFDGKARPPRHERGWGNFGCFHRFWDLFRCKRISSSRGFTQAINATWQEFERETGRDARSVSFADSVRFVHWYTGRVERVCGKDAARSDYAFYIGYYAGPGFCKPERLGGISKNKPEAHKLAVKFQKIAGDYRRQLEACG